VKKLRPSFRYPRGEVEGEDEWLLTYGDMMTLMLCFFLLIVSISEIDQTKFIRVAQSISAAIGVELEQERVSLDALYERVTAIVREEGLEEKVDVSITPMGVVIRLRGSVLFELGSAQLGQRAKPLLDRLARVMHSMPYKIAVQGHTDNIPISSQVYPSNWELSAARAAGVVRYLISAGVPPSRLEAAGYAETRPRVPNLDGAGESIPANQALNRRVEIIFLAG